MKKFFRPRKNQKGFTLVELVVVLGIMAALAAVVVPVVARFAGKGDTEANKTEVKMVQAAFDLYMSDNARTTITGSSTSTNAWSTVDPASVSKTMYPTYLRQSTTKCSYTWAADGTVTRVVNAACP
jgi:prepilin-type N-terminal cleavage/methylation domain-containing protein